MLKILVLLAMFIANPLIVEDPKPEVPVVIEEPIKRSAVVPVIEYGEPTVSVVNKHKAEPINLTIKDAAPNTVEDPTSGIGDSPITYYVEVCSETDSYTFFGVTYSVDDAVSCYYLICNDVTGCDPTYTEPHEKIYHDGLDVILRPINTRNELTLDYAFSLDNTPFKEAVIQEVCQE